MNSRITMRFAILLALMAVIVMPLVSRAQGNKSQTVTVMIFRENEALTLYLPDAGLVSIEKLTLEAEDVQGKVYSRMLSDFPAFEGLPFDRIIAPACFQLVGNVKNYSLPLECRDIPANRLWTQRLTPANMFWWDSVAQEPRFVFITDGKERYGQCPATLAQCEVPYTPPARDTSAPTPDRKAPAYKVVPITGQAVVKRPTPFRIGPGPQYEIIETVSAGTYDITGKTEDGSYYQLNFNGKEAWVTAFAQTIEFKLVDEQALPESGGQDKPLDATLTYGDSVQGKLERNGRTNYKFVGIAGETVSILVEGDFDGYLELIDPTGNVLAQDDNSGGNNQPQLNGVKLPRNGEYRIVLRGYNPRDMGQFSLTLSKGKIQATPKRDSVIKYGQKITDRLTPNGEVVHVFEGKKGDVVTISVTASFDSYIQLSDGDGNLVTSDNDSGGEGNPLIELFELPATGQYKIVVRGESPNGQGTFTLMLAQGTGPGEELVIKYGQSLNNTLEAGKRVVFAFEGNKGDKVSVTVECAFDAQLALRDSRGFTIAEDDDSGANLRPALMDVVLPEKGTYFLVVEGGAPTDFGPFSITVSAR